jgi:hypothetical protein
MEERWIVRQNDVLVQAAHDKVQKRAAVAQQRAAHYKRRADESRRALRQAQRTVRAFEVLRLAEWPSIVDSESTALQGNGDTSSWVASELNHDELGRRQHTACCLPKQVLAGKMPCNEPGVAHLHRGASAAHDPSLLWKLERLEHEVLHLSPAGRQLALCHGTDLQLWLR